MPSDNVRTRQEVTVTDIQTPFGSMVVFMVKWAIAAIPALAILGTAAAIIVALLSVATGLLAGVGNPFRSGAGTAAENPRTLASSGEGVVRSTKHDPKRAAGTGNIYMNSADRSIHLPGCEAVSASSSVGTWSEALGKGYSSHQCSISGE